MIAPLKYHGRNGTKNISCTSNLYRLSESIYREELHVFARVENIFRMFFTILFTKIEGILQI